MVFLNQSIFTICHIMTKYKFGNILVHFLAKFYENWSLVAKLYTVPIKLAQLIRNILLL
ncbi:hypothetical protein EJK51_0392 [Moraxella catarrhalis]|nr:hypothetical protein EJK52_0393 [Moraxella catarrhalis]AZQ91976.1 hypothetical protein EJK51_0392 [Moraxella catarrhalis]